MSQVTNTQKQTQHEQQLKTSATTEKHQPSTTSLIENLLRPNNSKFNQAKKLLADNSSPQQFIDQSNSNQASVRFPEQFQNLPKIGNGTKKIIEPKFQNDQSIEYDPSYEYCLKSQNSNNHANMNLLANIKPNKAQFKPNKTDASRYFSNTIEQENIPLKTRNFTSNTYQNGNKSFQNNLGYQTEFNLTNEDPSPSYTVNSCFKKPFALNFDSRQMELFYNNTQKQSNMQNNGYNNGYNHNMDKYNQINVTYMPNRSYERDLNVGSQIPLNPNKNVQNYLSTSNANQNMPRIVSNNKYSQIYENDENDDNILVNLLNMSQKRTLVDSGEGSEMFEQPRNARQLRTNVEHEPNKLYENTSSNFLPAANYTNKANNNSARFQRNNFSSDNNSYEMNVNFRPENRLGKKIQTKTNNNIGLKSSCSNRAEVVFDKSNKDMNPIGSTKENLNHREQTNRFELYDPFESQKEASQMEPPTPIPPVEKRSPFRYEYHQIFNLSTTKNESSKSPQINGVNGNQRSIDSYFKPKKNDKVKDNK